jgi:PAS domain S-box-containing protein
MGRDKGDPAARDQRLPGVLRQMGDDPERLARSLDEMLSLSLNHLHLFDRTLRLIYVNLPAAASFGLRREAMVGKSWLELGFPSNVAAVVESQLQGVFASGQTDRGSARLFTIDGARDFRYQLAPFRQEKEGSIQAVLATWTDVTEHYPRAQAATETERDQLMEKVQEANQELVASSLREKELAEEARRQAKEAKEAVRLRDEFLSVAAHELKTPVTSLRGFSQAIVRKHHNTGTIDQADLIRALKHIDLQARRLTNLAEQLLDSSRLQAGKLTISPYEADISPVIADALISIRESHPDRTFVVRDPASARAYIDPPRIEQVITNLVDNAVKFSPSDTPVEIDVAVNGHDQVAVSVRDYGIGVPANDRDSLFERFFQAHLQGHYGGVGLGLYISAQIVGMHGGTIFHEAPEGRGSRFVVLLPLKGQDGRIDG